MTVLEMHIATRHTIDRVNSLRNDNLRQEELDLELNRAMMRFINTRYGRNNIYGKGFEESQKRIDELRRLLTEYVSPAIFKEEVLDSRVWADTVTLPDDYMYMVNQSSVIWLDRCEPLSFTLEPLKDIIYYAFRPDVFLNVNGQFPTLIRIMSGSTADQATVWSPSQSLTTSGYSAAGYPQYMQQVISDILTQHQPGFVCAWETIGTVTVPGHILVQVDTDLFPWMEWDASIGAVTMLQAMDGQNNVVTQASPRIEDRSLLMRRVPDSSTAKLTRVLNRFSQQDDVYRLLDDPFSTTTHREPLTTVRANNVDIYSDPTFIVDSVKMTYLRKPSPISLSLGNDCELPDHTHEEIVRMTAQSILGTVNEQTYMTGQRELEGRE